MSEGSHGEQRASPGAPALPIASAPASPALLVEEPPVVVPAVTEPPVEAPLVAAPLEPPAPEPLCAEFPPVPLPALCAAPALFEPLEPAALDVPAEASVGELSLSLHASELCSESNNMNDPWL